MKKVFKFELKRKDALYLKFWVAPEVENLFKTEETRTSSNWGNGEPLKYYPRNYGSELAKFLSNHNSYDRFGEQFIYTDSGNKVNIGILRTVGCSKKTMTLKINEKYTQESLEKAIKNLKDMVALLYKNFCKPVSFSCTLTKREVL